FENSLAQSAFGEREEFDRVACLRNIGDQRLGCFDPVAWLGRPCFGTSLQPGQFLTSQVPTLFLRGSRETLPFRPFVPPIGITPLVLRVPAVDDLPGLRTHRIQEPPVVRHDYNSYITRQQMVREPTHSLDIEMVGRLVEHHEIAVADQGRGQRDPPPFPAGQCSGGRLQSQFIVTQSPYDRTNPRVPCPLVVGVETRQHCLTDRATVGEVRALCDNSQPQITRSTHSSAVRFGGSGQYFEQGRLTTTIQPDHTDPSRRTDSE